MGRYIARPCSVNFYFENRDGTGRIVSSALKLFRSLADPTRLRILALLERDELSVNELQEITRMGQSRISTHLRQLQEAALLLSRREGKRTFYKLSRSPCALFFFSR